MESSSFTLATTTRDGSVEGFGDRDLTSSRSILLYVVVELRHLLRKAVSNIFSLSLLSLKLDDSRHEFQDFVLDLSVLRHVRLCFLAIREPTCLNLVGFITGSSFHCWIENFLFRIVGDLIDLIQKVEVGWVNVSWVL